jgi:hypothetical protein
MRHDSDGSNHEGREGMENSVHARVRIATLADTKAILSCSKRFGPNGDTAAIVRNRVTGKHSSVFVIESIDGIEGWFQISKDGMANRLLIYSCPIELVPVCLAQLKDTLLGHTDRHAKVVVKEDNFELMAVLHAAGFSERETTGDSRLFVWRIGSGGTKGPRNRMQKFFEEAGL